MPDGTILEFPEGMSQEDMRNAIAKNFPQHAYVEQAKSQQQTPEDNSSGTLNFLKGAGVGAAESLANFGPSVANVALGPIDYVAGTNMSLPYWNFEKYRPKTTGGNIGHIAGNIAGMLAPGSAMTKAFTKLLGSPGVLKTAAATAAGNASVSGGEDELFRRGLASVTGLVPLLQGLRAKPIVKKAVERNKELGEHFSTEYENLFNTAEKFIPKEGGVRVPQLINSKKGTTAMSELPGAKKAVAKFTREPSIRNAHLLQSDLGKIVRKIEAANIGKPMTSTKIEAIDTAKKLQDRMRASMKEAFVKHDLKPLAQRYEGLTNEYREQMVPYLTPSLLKYSKNPKSTEPMAVLKAMLQEQGKPGNLQNYKDLPGFNYRKNAGVIIPPLLRYFAGPAAGLEGLSLLKDYLK